jgi:hypothetical protein
MQHTKIYPSNRVMDDSNELKEEKKNHEINFCPFLSVHVNILLENQQINLKRKIFVQKTSTYI